MDKRLPIIDVAPLFGADAAGKSVVAVDLHPSCKSRGFFYIKNHGIPESLTQEVFRETLI